MKRSASVDSLCSISSIAHTFGHDVTVGQLEVTLELEARVSLLHVTLHQAKDLLEKEEENFPGCYVTVTLLPDEINVGITRVRKQQEQVICTAMPSSFFLTFSEKSY